MALRGGSLSHYSRAKRTSFGLLCEKRKRSYRTVILLEVPSMNRRDLDNYTAYTSVDFNNDPVYEPVGAGAIWFCILRL
jgi:hypothetical protein